MASSRLTTHRPLLHSPLRPWRLGGRFMNSRAGTLAAISAIVLWSAGNLIVRDAPMEGVQIAFWRVSLGAVSYWLFLVMSGRRLTLSQLKASAPAGAAIALELAVFFVAIKSTTVANATVIAALQPLVVIAIGIKRFGEHVTRTLIVVSAIAITGVILVVFGSSAQAIWSPRGDVLAVVAMLLFAAYFIFAKHARAAVPAFEFQTGLWVVGAVVLLPVAVFDAGGLVFPTSTQWLWLVALLLVPGTGHFVMNWAHGSVSLSLTSLLNLGTPVLSTLGAFVFLNEDLGPVQIVGVVIVIAALAIVVTRESRNSIIDRLAAEEVVDL